MDFVIFAQAASMAEPGESPLDQPVPWQHFEQPFIPAVHNGQGPVEPVPDPIEPGASVSRKITATAKTNPRVSTAMGRMRPFTVLPASQPRLPRFAPAWRTANRQWPPTDGPACRPVGVPPPATPHALDSRCRCTASAGRCYRPSSMAGTHGGSLSATVIRRCLAFRSAPFKSRCTPPGSAREKRIPIRTCSAISAAPHCRIESCMAFSSVDHPASLDRHCSNS
jgi:hypothetical protein